MDNEKVCAPIALFAYSRVDHLQQTIASLQKNALSSESSLYIYSDGPKNQESEQGVAKVRAYVNTITGFKNVIITCRERNFGLAQSIIDGVTTLVNQFGKVIVVEDDLVLSPYFLQFMNDGLVFYQQEAQVASIHGYALPLAEQLPQTYFLKGADCWGWATWKRAWDHFEPDAKKLLLQLQQQNLNKEFNYNNSQPNIQMLKDQMNGKNNSWAIRWHASAMIKNMLTLYPGKSLVANIGLDNSGEHCVASSFFDVEITQQPIAINTIPIEKNIKAFEAYVRFFKSKQESLIKKIIRKAKSVLLKPRVAHA